MDDNDSGRDLIGRFLLGTAGEDERRQVEERLFAEDAYLDELQDREDALVDDYAHGRLGDVARAAFERRFLATPRGRERVAFARAAARVTPRAIAARTALPAWLPTAAAVLFAIAAGFMGVRTLRVEDERRAERDRFTTREQELTRALDEARRPPTPAQTATALVLDGHGTRDAGETPELKRTGAATIPIAVALPSGATYASYQAVLRTPEGALVWEDAGLQPEGSSIRLAIPADALPPGDYVLTLAGRRRTGPAAELADHYFRVVG